MAPNLEASGPELLMDAWCAVEAAVPFKHGLELGRDGCVLLGPWPLSGDSENWSRCELINTSFSPPGGTGADPTGCITNPWAIVPCKTRPALLGMPVPFH